MADKKENVELGSIQGNEDACSFILTPDDADEYKNPGKFVISYICLHYSKQ